MGYAILRTQKLKSAVAVHRSMKHAFRAQDTPNADQARTPDNEHIGAQSVAEGMAAYRAAMPDKVRKNAVHCIEYLVTASPEDMASKSRQEQDAYFQASLRWLRDKHGADNVIYAGIHRDETTPHMYAYVIPKDPETGKLNCRRFLGGAQALSEMQTDFHEKVGQHHGLQRGIKGSKAKHQRIKQWYASVNAPEQVPTVTAEELEQRRFKTSFWEKVGIMKNEESPQHVANRINAKIAKEVAPLTERAKQAENYAKEAKRMRATALWHSKQSEKFSELTEGLTEQQRRRLMAEMTVRSGQMRRERKELEEQQKQARLQKSKTRTKSRGFSL